MDTKEKLTALRSRMKEVGVAALYVGTTDPHQTESVAAHWKSVQWLTGFTGSMGYAVVTADDAEFWTDGRYKTQAQREIAEGTFHVNSISDAGTPDWDAWLMTKLRENDTLALDGEVLNEAMLRIGLPRELSCPQLYRVNCYYTNILHFLSFEINLVYRFFVGFTRRMMDKKRDKKCS